VRVHRVIHHGELQLRHDQILELFPDLCSVEFFVFDAGLVGAGFSPSLFDLLPAEDSVGFSDFHGCDPVVAETHFRLFASEWVST
jgi:hypothetical protein